MVNYNTIKLTKILKSNNELLKKVKQVKNLKINNSITESVNSLNFDLATHLFIMANYSDLMNIDI